LYFYSACNFFVCSALILRHNLKAISLNLQHNSGKSDGKGTNINDADQETIYTGHPADITVLYFFKVYYLKKIMTCKRICYGTPE